MKKITQMRKIIQTALVMVIVFTSCYVWANDIFALDDLLDSIWDDTDVHDDFQGDAEKWLAMKFTISDATANITAIQIRAERTAAAEGGDTVWASIYSISGGEPDTLLAASTARSANSLSTSESDQTFVFPAGLEVFAGDYALVMKATEIGTAYSIHWEKTASGSNAWYTMNQGSSWTSTTSKNYKIYGIAEVIEPTLLTGGINMINNTSGQVTGSIISLGTVTEYTQRGVEYGTVSGNLSESITASGTWTTATPFDTILTGLSPETAWYHRVKIYDGATWYYGNERSFSYNDIVPYVTIDTGEGVASQAPTDSTFMIAIQVEHTPDFVSSDNVTVYLSEDYPPVTNLVPMYDFSYYYFLRASDMKPAKRMSFSTSNVTTGNIVYGMSANTTYYYFAEIIFDSVSYNSTIKSFTTPYPFTPDKPSIAITSLLDIGKLFNLNYGVRYEAIARITSSNTTDLIYKQGIEVAASSALGLLSGKVYTFNASQVGIDSLFTVPINMASIDIDFTERTLYFQAFIKTPYYGTIRSQVIEFTPEINLEEEEDTTAILTIQEQVGAVKAQLGLVGAMGAWAFLGMLILLVSLLFGIAIVATKDDTLRRMIGVVWLIASIAILGAFIFTGQLGIWPVIILVGGVVLLIIMLASLKLSGSGGQV